jgi:hypothetical protein
MASSLSWLGLVPLSAKTGQMVLLSTGLGILCALMSLFASLAYVKRRKLLERIVQDTVRLPIWLRDIPLILRESGCDETSSQPLGFFVSPVLVFRVVAAASWTRASVLPLRAVPPIAPVEFCRSSDPTLYHRNWSFSSCHLDPLRSRRSNFSDSIARDGIGFFCKQLGRMEPLAITHYEQGPASMHSFSCDIVY